MSLSCQTEDMHALIIATAALLAIAFTTSVAPRLRVAAPLLLVLLGIGVSLVPTVPDVVVDPEWIISGVLPPLLYAAAVSMPAMDFRRDIRAIGGLSVALVVISAIALGVLFHALIPDLPLAAAIALGAIVSPTDAVATSIVREVGVSPRVTAVLQGESLLNDATALALLRSAVAVTVLTDVTATTAGVAWDFTRSLLIAIVVGLVVGRLNLRVRSRVKSSTANTVISLTVPFLASLPVEALDASGLVAAVVAGMVTGHGAPRFLEPSHRTSDEQNWRVIEFVLEGAVFLLMGLELEATLHQLNAGQGIVFGVQVALIALGALLLVRALYVTIFIWLHGRWQHRSGGVMRWLARLERDLADAGRRRLRIQRRRNDLDYYASQPLGWREGGVLTWAGMRGVVTLVAAQTLPADTPHRSLLVFIAFVVATVSLLLQGGTLAWAVRILRPAMPDPAELERERVALGKHLRTVVRTELERLPTDDLPESVKRQLAQHAPGAEDSDRMDTEARKHRRELRLRLIEAQRAALLEARSAGTYSSAALTAALDALDAEQIALELRRH